jgi:hypothetical protein
LSSSSPIVNPSLAVLEIVGGILGRILDEILQNPWGE